MVLLARKITYRCNIFTYDLSCYVYCLMSVCYEIYIALCKILGEQEGDGIFTKKLVKSAKIDFF